MNWVQYGGIQLYGQMLYGWMQRGVLGDEIGVTLAKGADASIVLHMLRPNPMALRLTIDPVRIRVLKRSDEPAVMAMLLEL